MLKWLKKFLGKRYHITRMDKIMMRKGKAFKIVLPNGNARYTNSPVAVSMAVKKYGRKTKIINLYEEIQR